MTRTSSFVFWLVPLVMLVACAGDDAPDDVDVSGRDPRCVSACTAPEPRYEGAGRVCDAGSHVQCLDECETRIANLPTVCQNCLVEEACFGPEGCFGIEVPDACNNNMCTITSEFGTCSFTADDEAGKLKCYQQVDPRREVSCTAAFRPTTECAGVCI